MAVYFGKGSRSRKPLRDEDVVALLEDGNFSDIEEFEDLEDIDDLSSVLENMQDDGDEVPMRPILSESPPLHPQQVLKHQPRVSAQRPRSRTTERSGTWKQVPYHDKPHEYLPCPAGPVTTPIEYVKKYFDDDFYKLAAYCTNTYHMRKTGVDLKTNPQEIAKLFGIHLVMGLIPYPRLPKHWQSSTRLPLIADKMGRDRFIALRNALHVVDSDTPPSAVYPSVAPNPLWKVQPIIDRARDACYKLERVPGYYSIDEQMIPFTGRCFLRQVVKNKPRPVGLKNFVLTTTDGLMLDFEIYKGAKTMFGNSTLGLGPSVVIHLIKTIPPGSCIYHDRYFSTVPLVEELHRRKVHSTGTIMMNRIPGRTGFKFKSDRSMFRGEHQQFVRDNISLVKWKDNKSVIMVSNCTGAEFTDYVKRWDKQTKCYKDITAPRVIANYTKHMGGVDVLDQMIEYYRIFIKTKKWTLKVMIHFLDLAVVNAWRKYKIDCEADKRPRNKVMDLLDFKMDVAEALMNIPSRSRRLSEDLGNDNEPPPVKKKYIPAKPSDSKRYDGYDHLPTFDELTTPRTCRREICTSRSKIRCIKCNVYLCLSRGKDCFQLYHTRP